MLNLKNTKISISLRNIIDKVFFVLELILMMMGLIFLFSITLRFIIVNPSIYKPINYKTSKNVKNSIIILEKHLKRVNRH